jgi:DNA polymerase V
MSNIIALVDANSFYASCEIAFNPALNTRPVVVLSNNDGCIVAANARAKTLLRQFKPSQPVSGFKAAQATSMMFQPYFKVKHYLARYQTAVFSSNYELYADMSNRLHRLLSQFAPVQEIYSIDESFLDFTGINQPNLTDYGQHIRHTIQRGLGLPVAVGIGTTKTLAKLANHLAKRQTAFEQVLDLSALSPAVQDTLLKQVAINDVWGIGQAHSDALKAQGIGNAYQLKNLNPRSAKQRFSINIERIVHELNGQPCFALNIERESKQHIMSSKSFGRPITDLAEMEQAVASYCARAAEKLRAQHSTCHTIGVSIRTNPFQQTGGYYANQHLQGLIYPCDNTSLLIKMAKRALKAIWRPGLAYQKASVMLSDIQTKSALQLDIFAPNPKYSANPAADKLMQVMDQINQKMGRGTLKIAAEGLTGQTDWQMRRDYCSPRYTTRWQELPIVR